jgi:hypothetical protein
MDKGMHGSKADSRFDAVISLISMGNIPIGRGVIQATALEQSGRLPAINQAVITDDGDTYTAGDIVTTVNGTAVTTSFDTDKNTTLTAHAADILAAIDDLSSCAYVAGSHTITLISKNTDLAVTVDISGITGDMSISSVVLSTTDTAAKCAGVCIQDGTLLQDSNGLVQYVEDDVMSVVQQGAVYLYPEETVTVDSTVYFRITDGGTGKPVGGFGASADSGKCVTLPGARWAMGGGTSEVAKLELNLPQ